MPYIVVDFVFVLGSNFVPGFITLETNNVAQHIYFSFPQWVYGSSEIGFRVLLSVLAYLGVFIGLLELS